METLIEMRRATDDALEGFVRAQLLLSITLEEFDKMSKIHQKNKLVAPDDNQFLNDDNSYEEDVALAKEAASLKALDTLRFRLDSLTVACHKAQQELGDARKAEKEYIRKLFSKVY
jgi:hypothetical protein